MVESYPHDLTDQTKKMSSSFLYNGTRRLYERLGFTYERPKGLKNCVMSIDRRRPLDRYTPRGMFDAWTRHTPRSRPRLAPRHGQLGTNAMAISATLHCLTGCAIGEILGLMVGTALGLGNLAPSPSRSAWRSSSATPCRRCRSCGPASGSAPR